jgi:hypothetical protein
VLSDNGELRDADNNLGTIPTRTLATWFYTKSKSSKKLKVKVVLQRMYLDARKGGWLLRPEIDQVRQSDPILDLFRPLPAATLDTLGYHSIISAAYPQTLGGGNDWAIWNSDNKFARSFKSAHDYEDVATQSAST